MGKYPAEMRSGNASNEAGTLNGFANSQRSSWWRVRFNATCVVILSLLLAIGAVAFIVNAESFHQYSNVGWVSFTLFPLAIVVLVSVFANLISYEDAVQISSKDQSSK